MKRVGSEQEVQGPGLGRSLGIIGRSFGDELHQTLLRAWQFVHHLIRRKHIAWDGIEGDAGQLQQFSDLLDGECSLKS